MFPQPAADLIILDKKAWIRTGLKREASVIKNVDR